MELGKNSAGDEPILKYQLPPLPPFTTSWGIKKKKKDQWTPNPFAVNLCWASNKPVEGQDLKRYLQ